MPHIVDDDTLPVLETAEPCVPHVVPSLPPPQREGRTRITEPILAELGGVPDLPALGSILDPFEPAPADVPKEDKNNVSN